MNLPFIVLLKTSLLVFAALLNRNQLLGAQVGKSLTNCLISQLEGKDFIRPVGLSLGKPFLVGGLDNGCLGSLYKSIKPLLNTAFSGQFLWNMHINAQLIHTSTEKCLSNSISTSFTLL